MKIHRKFFIAGNVMIAILVSFFLNQVQLIAQQTPYGGTPRNIPGLVEIEDFDNGGEGVAYHDNDASNNGDGPRQDEGVDIHASADNGSPTIGWFKDGEWMEYTVNVTSGTYNINIRVANPDDGRQLKIYLDEVLLTTMNVPNTGSYSTWQTTTVTNINISGGSNKILKLENVNNDYDFNWIEFVNTSSQNYTLTTSVVGSGSITPVSGAYTADTVLSLNAIPGTGYEFDSWSGDVNGNSNPVSLTMNSNKSVTATFVEEGSTPSGESVWEENASGAYYMDNVGIGNQPLANYRLAVDGKIIAKEIKVEASPWADFVFEEEYDLKGLEELEKYITEENHLPDVPSANEVEENGINVGEMNAILLRKIEEMTLYIIQLNERIEHLQQKNYDLETDIEILKNKTDTD